MPYKSFSALAGKRKSGICKKNRAPKKVVATASRREGVYNRAGAPSVPFWDRGGVMPYKSFSLLRGKRKNGIYADVVPLAEVERQTLLSQIKKRRQAHMKYET